MPPRVVLSAPAEYAGGEEMVWAAKMLAQALALRAKYAYVKPSLKERVMAEPLPEPSAVLTTHHLH
jgi:hypothetical protein